MYHRIEANNWILGDGNDSLKFVKGGTFPRSVLLWREGALVACAKPGAWRVAWIIVNIGSQQPKLKL
jgi:hypothetical protein